MSDNFHLLELIEKERLDEVLHGFTEITGVSSFIVDPEGKPISDEYNWTRLCSDYCRSTEEGRRRCYESDRYGGEMSAKLKKRFIYPCLNAGLIDCTSPIIVGNYRHQEKLFGVPRIFLETTCDKKCMKVVKTAHKRGHLMEKISESL